MEPTQERLKTSYLAGARVYQRLIVKLQLSGNQRTSQLELKRTTRLNTSVHFRFKKAICSATIRLSSIHCQVGIFEQLIRIYAIGWCDGNANTCTYIYLLPFDFIGCTYSFDNTVPPNIPLIFGATRDSLELWQTRRLQAEQQSHAP